MSWRKLVPVVMVVFLVGSMISEIGCKKKEDKKDNAPPTDSGGGVVPAPDPANPDPNNPTSPPKKPTPTPAKFTLTIEKAGARGGTVTSDPAGINCGTECSATFPEASRIKLTAKPEGSGAIFSGWAGACSGTAECELTLDEDKHVVANFNNAPVVRKKLTVALLGEGSGSIHSDPSGIDCGTSCAVDFDQMTSVTLTASPSNSFSIFSGWSGDCSGVATCVLSLEEDKNVNATFEVVLFDLTVTKSGDGVGTVVSDIAGIDCGGDCSEKIKAQTHVTLTATPADSASVFTGWQGDCSGTGACVMTMDAAKNVTAQFELTLHTLTITKTGDGTGTVQSAPPGVSCGSDCSEDFQHGALVRLSQTQEGGYFTGWGGACSGDTTCDVLMDQVRTVNASFENVTVDGDYCQSGGGFIFCFFVRGNKVVQTALGPDSSQVCFTNFFSGNTIVNRAVNVDDDFAQMTGQFVSAFRAVGHFDESASPCPYLSIQQFDFEVTRPRPAAVEGYSAFGRGGHITYNPNAVTKTAK